MAITKNMGKINENPAIIIDGYFKLSKTKPKVIAACPYDNPLKAPQSAKPFFCN